MTRAIYSIPRPALPHIAGTHRAAGPWLITIVDLMFVLVAFFVLLFSMSRVEVRQFQEVAKSYAETFGPALDLDAPAGGPKLPKIATISGDDIGYLGAVMESAFAAHPTLREIEFSQTPQYLMLSLPVAALYAPGSGNFADSAKASVFDLAGVLSNLNNRIAIVGTAAMSQAGIAPPAAWSLAMMRAEAMADALRAQGYDQTVAVVGRGGVATDVAAAIGKIDILILPERTSP
jgi:flagellar motor protein MotB